MRTTTSRCQDEPGIHCVALSAPPSLELDNSLRPVGLERTLILRLLLDENLGTASRPTNDFGRQCLTSTISPRTSHGEEAATQSLWGSDVI